MRIRTSQGTGTCTRAAAWACHRSGHDTVCADCLRKSQTALVGRPGVTASTDLYDAQVRKEVTRREGTVFHLAGLQSRRPPFIPPNWNTSYRLQCSVLVALVPVDFAGEPLTRQHPILWGEIVASDVMAPKLEGDARRNRELTVRLLSRGDCAALRSEADAPLEAGAAVVVVDMRVFVPEVVSVLATFAEPSFAQEIAHIPFIGRLIGCEPSPALLQVGQGESIDSCVLRAVMGSEIDCVRNLANDVRQAIAQEICRLAPVRSLYGTQLQAFAAALMGSVHCTQGPPGTGKSYVGVCLVLALTVIRKHANKYGCNLGPVVMLSYKNHALDEFLSDVVEHAPRALLSRNPTDFLVRCGRPENEQLLDHSERNSPAERHWQGVLAERIADERKTKLEVVEWHSTAKTLLFVDGTEQLLVENLPVAKRNLVAAMMKFLTALGASADGPGGFAQLEGWVGQAEHWLIEAGTRRYAHLPLWLEQWLRGSLPPPRCAAAPCLNCAGLGPYCAESHACASALQPACLHHRAPDARLCPAHRCSAGPSACSEERLPSVAYCADHCCALCLSLRLSRGQREVCMKDGEYACLQHQCAVIGCAMQMLLPHTFCQLHCCEMCVYVGEVRNLPRTLESQFCQDHLCYVDGCMRHRDNATSSYCAEHSCHHLGCLACIDLSSRAARRAQLCADHRCSHPTFCAAERLAEAEAGARADYCSPFCTAHTCRVCWAAGLGVGGPVLEALPRNTCALHPLCQQVLQDGSVCAELGAENSAFCAEHVVAQAPLVANIDELLLYRAAERDGQCCGRAKKSNQRCKAKCQVEPAPLYWYCLGHLEQQRAVDAHLEAQLELRPAPADLNPNLNPEQGVEDEDSVSDGEWEEDFNTAATKESDSDSADDYAEAEAGGGAGAKAGPWLPVWDVAAPLALASAQDPAFARNRLVQCTGQSLRQGGRCGACTLVTAVEAAMPWLCAAHADHPDLHAPPPPPPPLLPAPPVLTVEQPTPEAQAGVPRRAKRRVLPAAAAIAKPIGEDGDRSNGDSDYEILFGDGDNGAAADAGKGDMHPDELDVDFDLDNYTAAGGGHLQSEQGVGGAPTLANGARGKRGANDKDDGDSDLDSDGDADEEAEVNEEQRRLQEIYGDDYSDAGSADESDAEDGPGEESASVDPSLSALAALQEWSWALPRRERHAAASRFLRSMAAVLGLERTGIAAGVMEARRERAVASSAALKRTQIVGATVVGASRRLQALRAAEPFAVVVEEACEVMEPTLLSVLAVKSLKKLELIGDHRQLPAFVQNCWFNLQSSLPSINTSLFERLISGQVARKGRGRGRGREDRGTVVPCTILDEQRRMRDCIADITRPDYEDIVTITDHPHTAQQLIGDQAVKLLRGAEAQQLALHRELWHGQGRAVPGLRSCVYFWDLPGNAESRPEKGLSACNRAEAEAVTQLTKHLLYCGVPAPAITIITPYKGQMMLITRLLREARILPPRNFDPNSSPPPSVLVSTVDRYQGDENDVVILSLVRVRPGNRFVALRNRFIVAVSRPRLGLFVVGSVGAVAQSVAASASASARGGPEHWQRFIHRLEDPMLGTGEERFDLSRVGPALPLCCPYHYESQLDVTKVNQFPTAANWNATICGKRCRHALQCGHMCKLLCHNPSLILHSTSAQCAEKILRPCTRHAHLQVRCGEIGLKPEETIQLALARFHCDLEVKGRLPDCGHYMIFKCWEYEKIQKGSMQIPLCQEEVDDFIHPSCGHRFSNLRCHQRQQHEACPPQCTQRVQHQRPCGCQLPLQCHEAGKESAAPVQCKRSVNALRPRCQHPLSLKCCTASKLRLDWQQQAGLGIEAGAVVEHGGDYGVTESALAASIPECQVKLSYRASCGHLLRDVPCARAFQYASGAVPEPCCEAPTELACPMCRDPVQAPCSMVAALTTWDPWGLAVAPADRVGQELMGGLRVYEASIVAARPSLLPPSTLHCLKKLCSNRITLQRSCQEADGMWAHIETWRCKDVVSRIITKQSLHPCDVRMERQLDCEHSVQVKCAERNVQPAPLCTMVNQEVYAYPCGLQEHRVVPRTCSTLWNLRAMQPQCIREVDCRLGRCGHLVRVPCCERDAVEIRDGGLDRSTWAVLDRDVDAGPQLKQGDNADPDLQQLVVQAETDYSEPVFVGLDCQALVAYQYGCGHLVMGVPCFEAFAWAANTAPARPCQQLVSDTHPVCGHVVQAQCWAQQEAEGWQAWGDAPLGRPQSQMMTGLDAAGRVVEMEVVREVDAVLAFRLPPHLHNALRCGEAVRLLRDCGHETLLPCHRAFSAEHCSELVRHECPSADCRSVRFIPCHEYCRQERAGMMEPCRSQVVRPCSICQVNLVSTECCKKDPVCRRPVTAPLPICRHEVAWHCGDQPDPRLEDSKMNELTCKACALPVWEEILDSDETPQLPDFLTKARVKMDHTLGAICRSEVHHVLDTEQFLKRHLEARSRMLQQQFNTMREKEDMRLWVSLPDDFASDHSLRSCYHLVFVQLKNAEEATPAFLQKCFQRDQDTNYGRGVKLQRLTSEQLGKLEPDEEGRVHVAVGLVYSLQALTDTPPFMLVDRGNENQRKKRLQKVNTTAVQMRANGFDCAEMQQHPGCFVHWEPGSAVPLACLALQFTASCAICMDVCLKKEGFFCSQGHFVCWEGCFGPYAEAAAQPGAQQSLDGEGNLLCPHCKEPYNLHRIAQGGPNDVFERLMKLKFDVLAGQKVEKELEAQRVRLEEEHRRIQAMEHEDRGAFLLYTDIVDSILNLRCPACKAAFVDFEGCFALTCGRNNCRRAFCAWCLADCGNDAHAHVAHCAEGGGMFGSLDVFNAHHRKRRSVKVAERLRGENKKTQGKVLKLLKKDLEDLNITVTL